MKSKMYWGAAILILLLVTASVFVILREIADNRELNDQLTEAQKLADQINQRKISENNKKSELDIPLQPKDTDSENFTAEVENNTEAETPKQSEGTKDVHASVQTAETKDVQVSPFGFGPYPEVPEGMLDSVANPYKPAWERSYWSDRPREGAELLSRVLIKAWKEGNRDWIGASQEDGKVRINYPNTLYIQYGEPETRSDGTIYRPIVRTKGDPSVRLTLDQMENGIVPAGVRVLDFDTDAINIFEYLNLSRK